MENQMVTLNKIRLLDKGSFAEVYLACEASSNKLFALKKINQKQISLKEKSYLENEIKILSMIHHPNIIQLYQVYEKKDYKYLALEYCNGDSLYKNLTKHINKYGKPFSEKLVQKLMKNILSGVKCLHDKGIIHRDLKLENILVKYKNDSDLNNLNLYNAEIKIIDFNLSYMSNNVRPTSGLGTPINMAPTMVINMMGNNIIYDEKVDIWSLGTICYEMLFGEPLFPYFNRQQIFNNILSYNFKIPKTISVEARTFLYSMLRKEGINRLSVTELLNHEFIIGDYHKFKRYNHNAIENNNIAIVPPPLEMKQILHNETFMNNHKNRPNITPNETRHNFNDICIGCGKNIIDIVYKCTQCFGLIVCQSCYLNSFDNHKHPFKMKTKGKIITNNNLLNIQQVKQTPVFNNTQKNIIFNDENGGIVTIVTDSYNTINELINLYLLKIGKIDMINNYDNKMNFICGSTILNNNKNIKIEKIFSKDSGSVKVIKL